MSDEQEIRESPGRGLARNRFEALAGHLAPLGHSFAMYVLLAVPAGETAASSGSRERRRSARPKTMRTRFDRAGARARRTGMT
jgi:hypothetical protein